MEGSSSFFSLDRKQLPKIFAVFAAIALVLYGRAVTFGFMELDDSLLIFQNPAILHPSLASVKTIFTSYDPELYIPLTLVSYQIDAVLSGVQPWMFHLTNIVLHTCNAFLVGLFLAYLTRKPVWGWATGLLFLVHPLHTEAAVWASSRKDLLSTFFLLLSLILYVRAARGEMKRGYWPSIMLFALGLLSKVSIIMAPMLLFVIDFFEGRRLTGRSILEKAPYIVLAIIFGIIAIFGKIDVSSASAYEQILLGVRSTAFYLGKLVWPYPLSILYPARIDVHLLDLDVLLPLVAILAAGTVSVLKRKQWPVLFLGVCFFLVMLFPSFFNLAKGPMRYTASDRYAYVPSIGVLLLFVWCIHAALSHLLQGKGEWKIMRAEYAVLALLMFVASVRTFAYSSVWVTSGSLARHVVALYPGPAIGELWLGNVLRDEGKAEEALEHYDRALAVRTDQPQVYYNRALAFELLDRSDDALESYNRALALDPHYPLAHINAGRLLYERGDATGAAEHFAAAAADAPQLAMPHFNLGVIAGDAKAWEKAAAEYQIALQKDDTLVEARLNLVDALLHLQKPEEALAEYRILLDTASSDSRVRSLGQYLRDQGFLK